MRQISKRLTYANVMSTIGIFLVLGGATAFAATQLEKNSVGARQLQSNAVTAAKIKKNAVTRAKIKANSINSSKVAKNSLTGADIKASSTSFSRIVAQVRGTGNASFGGGQIFPLSNPTYTQDAGEDNQILAGLQVHVPASCGAPRKAQAYLLLDPTSPPVDTQVIGAVLLEDKGSGDVTQQLEFSPYIEAFRPMAIVAPAASATHTFAIYLASSSCGSGSGPITATSAAIDVIGTK